MWPTWRRDLAALAAVVALGWFGLRGRVPLLSGVDLGFHELGHLVCYVLDALLPWPEVLTAAAGSFTQVAVPLGLAVYFLGRDRHAAALCLAWAGTSARDVSVYVADAPYEALPLLGGHHDWAAVLGPEHLDRLHQAEEIASVIRGAGVALVVAAAVLLVAPVLQWAWRDTPARPPRRSATGPRV
ncbi:MAG TPA: hypothetical protein VEA78_08165 [Acidimicrobiales bacterium]|nr:hypothetical protein [Acidimicrobiales bacterium]